MSENKEADLEKLNRVAAAFQLRMWTYSFAVA